MHERTDPRGIWLFIGGSVQKGGVPKDVAMHKVKNELGFTVPELTFFRSYTSNEVTKHGSVHVFVA